jgi:hypothetical protein
MHAILAGGLASAARAAIGWGVGYLRGKTEAGRALRRAVTEIVVAGAAGASAVALGIGGLSGSAPLWSFLGGAAWSISCEVCRVLATRRLRRASGELGGCLRSGKPVRTWSRKVLRHATGWPGAFWHEMLHVAGLSDATGVELEAYETYRSQGAWNARFRDRRNDWPFTKWMWREEMPILLVAVVGNVLYLATLSKGSAYTALVQAVVVFLFLVGVRDPLIDPNNRDDAEAARMFHRCWCAVLASWAAYYLMLYWTKVVPTVPPQGEKNPLYGPREVTMQFINNLNTCFLLFGYFVLRDPPSLVGERSHRWCGLTSLEWKGVVLAAALAIVSVADAFWTWRGWHGSIHYFEWIGDAAAGVSMALLIARLESKMIAAPVALIALLYWYAVLQGVPIGFGGPSEVESLYYLLALALKSLFVLLMTWVFASQRLTVYFQRLRYFETVSQTVDRQFEEVVLGSD